MHPQGALQRLKEAQRARQLASQSSPQQHLASASDAGNEAYMQRFEQAFNSLSAGAPAIQQRQAPGQSAGNLQSAAASAANKHAALQQTSSTRNAQQAAHATAAKTSASSPDRIASNRPRPGATLPAADATGTGAVSCNITAQDKNQEASGAASSNAATPLAAGWRTGPANEAGVLVQLSDRPIMCSAAQWDASEVVVGSSDHALYVVDIQQGKKKRTLYSKTCGHTEWVTCVCYLPGGKILSGGMDGRLWLWPSAGSSGTEVKAAHSAPVSKVASLTPPTPADSGSRHRAVTGPSSSRGAAAAGHQLAVSCSYDKTVKVWDVSNSARVRDVAVLSGHTSPVLELDVLQGGGSIVTGDRTGDLMCWDLGSGSSSWGVSAAHQGHVTALTWQRSALQQQQQHVGAVASSSSCVLSGGQDGCVRVWDGRSGDCVAANAVHVDKKGKGAVGNINAGCGSRGDLVVTCGADMTLRVLDPRMSYQPLHTIQLTDYPYSLAAIGNLAVCGCGDGSVHVVDVGAGETLYALGAGKAAVRAIEVLADTMVCTGDDGYVISYSFS